MSRKKRRARTRKEDPDFLGTAPGKGWDRGIQRGSLVFIKAESSPHIYEVVEYHCRLLLAHEVYNHPGLVTKGLKEGDEIPPFLVLRRKFNAPFYEPTHIRKVYIKRVDGSKVSLITPDVVAELISNLHYVLDEIP